MPDMKLQACVVISDPILRDFTAPYLILGIPGVVNSSNRGTRGQTDLSNFLFIRCRDYQSRISGRPPSNRIILIPRHEVNLKGYR